MSVSGISISGADANNYLLANTTASAMANITVRPLTITAHGVDRQYDGTTSATVTLSDDRLSGDVFIDSYTSASFADKNVGGSKAVSVSGISISGADASNYNFNTSASTTANISRLPITVTAVTDTKVYDGTTTSAGVPSAPGIAAGDTGNFTQAFDMKNAGPRTLIPAGSVADGNAGNNYAVTFMNANGTISQRPITITADAKTKVYGENDPALTYQLTSGSLVVGDSFSGALSRASGENVSTYAIQQGTLTLGNNYAISYAGASLSITPAPLTITPDGGKTKTLDTVFTAFTGSITGLKFNDAVTVTYASTGAPAACARGKLRHHCPDLQFHNWVGVELHHCDQRSFPRFAGVLLDSGLPRRLRSSDSAADQLRREQRL